MASAKARLATTLGLALCVASSLALWLLADGARSASYQPEALTISVDRGARELSGTLVADSTYWHFCWGDGDAHVKIRHLQPGRDKLVAEDQYTDFDRKWKVRLHSTAIKGKRVYAEVPGFDNCAPARSRVVRAP